MTYTTCRVEFVSGNAASYEESLEVPFEKAPHPADPVQTVYWLGPRDGIWAHPCAENEDIQADVPWPIELVSRKNGVSVFRRVEE